MRKPKLKPKSAEFEIKPQALPRLCDVPGCSDHGEFKAPKSRKELRDYYWFCLDHVREYNRNWDYFTGMGEADIEDHIRKSTIWDRPTWKFTARQVNDTILRQRLKEHFGFAGFEEPDAEQQQDEEIHFNPSQSASAEVQALSVLNISPPTNLDEIKTRYKKLAKKFHPDLNNGCRDAEEKLKKINIAYTVLKIAFQKYSSLADAQ